MGCAIALRAREGVGQLAILAAHGGNDRGDVEASLTRVAHCQLGIDRRQIGEEVGLFEEDERLLQR